MKTILVTGPRDYDPDHKWWVEETLDSYRLLVWPGNLRVIEGGCPTGVDRYVRDWRYQHRVPGRTFKANWRLYGKAAGPIRNTEMVDTEPIPDLCIGFPNSDPISAGTLDCLIQAEESGIETLRMWLPKDPPKGVIHGQLAF